MVDKPKRMNEASGTPAYEGRDPLDLLDGLNEEVGFLREVIKLLRAASSDRQTWGYFPLARVTDDMLERLEKVRTYGKQLYEHCRGENMTSGGRGT